MLVFHVITPILLYILVSQNIEGKREREREREREICDLYCCLVLDSVDM